METMKRFGLLAGLVLFSAMGCNQQDQDNLTKDTARLTEHAGEAISSTTLGAKVQSVLMLRKGVDTGNLHIDAEHGVVTMTGHVKDEAERKLVIDTVDGIKGVDKVVDKLKVGAE